MQDFSKGVKMGNFAGVRGTFLLGGGNLTGTDFDHWNPFKS